MSDKARRVPARLLDMREAIANARSDIGTLSKDEFLADGKTQRAVIESLIVIGEAANIILRLDPDLQKRMPDAWQSLREAYDMRIVLTHEYFRIDAAIVWDTVNNDLPELDALVESLLA